MFETEDKLDHIIERVASIDTTLKFQADQLKDHIKRTEMLEKRVIPIEDHIKFLQRIGKILIWTLSIPGVIALLLKTIGKI